MSIPRNLRARLTLKFFAVSAASALFVTAIVLVETHVHFLMFTREAGIRAPEMLDFGRHLEMALVQSVLWSTVGTLALAAVFSFFVAAQVARPLLDLRQAALKSQIEALMDGVWTPDPERFQLKLEAPDFRLEPGAVDLGELVEKAVEVQRAAFLQKSVDLALGEVLHVVVEAHGGAIRLASEVGRGTEVIIELPCRRRG
ncbi:MAG: hypothetical protein IMW86_06405 [Hydrogenibacillus sp.]|nr:hypothetical protein [Hydrogenibacillus sp.]